MKEIIVARNVNKFFGKVCAVNDLNLQIAEGEIYGLVGPDGAGKTTTVRLLCGALYPTPSSTPASIMINGIDCLRATEQARSQLGYLAQRFSLYEDLTVLENLRFFAEVRGLKSSDWQARCMEILAFVGLDAFTGRRAGFLSGGMKQKLGLAAALVHRPKVLLLDEPTTGVDPVTRQDFWQLIIRLVAEERVAALVSTPYMDEASRCTRVGFMQHGHLLVEGPPGLLQSRLNGRILEMAGHPLPLLRRLAREDQAVEDAQMFGDRLHLRVRGGEAQAVMDRLEERIPSQGGNITRLRSVPPLLEDVFIAMAEGKI
jgi:ABC-2 type transport system ATP-binding protein